MKKIQFIIYFCVFWATRINCYSADDGAYVEADGLNVTLGNGFLNITFHANATVKSLYKNGINLVKNIDLETWYLDWNGEKVYFNPSSLNVISNSSEKAHVAYVQQASTGLWYIEFHLVVLKNVSGLYQYVKVANPTNESIDMGEFRTVHRFDHELMPKVTNIIYKGETPYIWDRPTIQDTTWQLKDGTYWSKYDLCGYIRETPWFGVYGGGFGGFIVSASREYHSAGPLKQELLVHEDSLMLNYFHSGHFGTPGLNTPTGWSKFYGPVLVYINAGSEDEVLADAAKQAVIEQAQWPYSWVEDEEYPLIRGSISGKITGQTKAMVVAHSSIEEQFDLQTLGYTYNAETEDDGSFRLNNLRPGYYTVTAYPLAGHGSENVAQKNVTVTAGSQEVVSLNLPEPTGIIWSIGETNRRSDRYHYSDEPRNFYWHLLPPANLTFTIGKSNIAKDWYYAQTRLLGSWTIAYDDKPDGNERILRLAFAAASRSGHIQVEVNGNSVGNFQYENDQTIYRDALQSGRFHSEKVAIPADIVLDGKNFISFRLLNGLVMYDSISLARDN